MARTARQFPQGKFTLRTPKQTNNGHTEYVIYIYYYWQGRQLHRSTDLSVNRSDWNQNANNGVGELRYHLHPEASFYGEVEGESMRDAGIFDGDLVIIDRAVEPHDGSIIVAWWEDGFTMKYLDLTHRSDGYIELRPANDEFPVFKVDDPDTFEIFGTVIHLIRRLEKI